MDLSQIIKEAQQGNQEAKDQLIQLMLDDNYIKQLNRYLYLNRLLEPDDVRGEFWLGVVRAIPKVHHDIGNPLQYLTYSGIRRVQSKLRQQIQKNVFLICHECNKTSRLWKKDVEQCPKCGSQLFDTLQYELTSDLTIFSNQAGRHPNPRKVAEHNEITEKRKNRLSPQELRVFNMVIERGYDRDSCVNYIREIAEEMQISAQCVNTYLNKIKDKI